MARLMDGRARRIRIFLADGYRECAGDCACGLSLIQPEPADLRGSVQGLAQLKSGWARVRRSRWCVALVALSVALAVLTAVWLAMGALALPLTPAINLAAHHFGQPATRACRSRNTT